LSAGQALKARYQARITEGLMDADAAQAEAVALLSSLADRLKKPASFHLFSKPKPIIGLYLWGGVGRGKSMLMDLFFDAAPRLKKRRVHFHEFMADVHERLNAWRKLTPDEIAKSPHRVSGTGDDPIPPVARAIASEAKLLCFDEFQVTHITDAMILSRLFDALFAEGVTVVATSNRAPDTLYEGGINRALFLPFIHRLKEHCSVFELRADRDYRLDRLIEAPSWYAPLDAGAAAAMNAAWARLTLSAQARATTLTVQARKLAVPREAAGVARFSFDELCARPLGAMDYLTLAAHFHTLLIENIPRLTPDKRNEAARFVMLIDALYEAKVKLIASAAARPEALYPEGDGQFEFERTVSRLHEMQSRDYLAQAIRVPDIARD
jgi:cell division protein ZapE